MKVVYPTIICIRYSIRYRLNLLLKTVPISKRRGLNREPFRNVMEKRPKAHS